MPIVTKALSSAQVAYSKNGFLNPLWKAVDTYNLSGGKGKVSGLSKRFEAFQKTGALPKQSSELSQKAAALQDIMRLAAGYLTCKPPNSLKHKRHARWDAMTDLVKNVAIEAEKIGVKLVDSPSNFQNITEKNSSVWLEVIDPKHRPFNEISNDYSKWLTDANAIKKNMSFWDWRGDTRDQGIVIYDQRAKYFVEENKQGLLTDVDGQPVDTCKVHSHHGGNGWGIFAIDAEMRMHVSEHSESDNSDCVPVFVRHTSLTDGAPIVAAGEICVVKGKIRAISNLTGHYKLGYQQFSTYVAQTTQIPSDAVVKILAVFPDTDHKETALATAGSVAAWKKSGGPDGDLDVIERSSAEALVPQASFSGL